MKSQPVHPHRYLTEFQSHEPEFDYLKSLEIEEKINKVGADAGRAVVVDSMRV